MACLFGLSSYSWAANAWLWEDSGGGQNMSWSGSGTVSGGDTNSDGDGDQDYVISNITTAGGTLSINEIGAYHQGSTTAYPVSSQPFNGGADIQISVNGDTGAEASFTVDLIGTTANPHTYRAIFDIAPNEFVTSVELTIQFDGLRQATTPDGGDFGSFAMSWTNAATIGEVLTVNTEVTGISINGGNLVNPTVGGTTVGSRTPGTSLGVSGNTYSAELDGTQEGNNHGIWSLDNETTNGTFTGLNVTITPNDGQFDGTGYFRYSFDGLTTAPIPEPSSGMFLIATSFVFLMGSRIRNRK